MVTLRAQFFPLRKQNNLHISATFEVDNMSFILPNLSHTKTAFTSRYKTTQCPNITKHMKVKV